MSESRERLQAIRELQGLLIAAMLVCMIVGFAAGMALVMLKFELTAEIAVGLVLAVSSVLFLTGYLVSKLKRLVVI